MDGLKLTTSGINYLHVYNRVILDLDKPKKLDLTSAPQLKPKILSLTLQA